MENEKHISQLEEFLREAMELLEHNKMMLAMFNRQYYNNLKARVKAYHNLNKNRISHGK